MQRLSSPTIDSGDPLIDQGLPASEQNLLTNPGFESGLAGWTANPNGATQSSSPAPWDGSNYFTGGTNADTTVQQSVDLLAAGFTPAQLDSQDFVAVFGGRVRSAAESPADTGAITLTFLAANGTAISHLTVPAQNTSDRWQLIGSRLTLPVGTRKLIFTFEAVKQDRPNLRQLPGRCLRLRHGQQLTRPIRGPTETRRSRASRSPPPTSPCASPTFTPTGKKTHRTTSSGTTYNNATNAQVRIDLYQDGPNGPQFLTNITLGTPDTGSFTWIPADSGIAYGTHGLRIEVSLVGSPNVFDRGTEPFAVPENTNTFFVNGATVSPGGLTTAPGSNRNTGKLASSPKPYPNNILRIYTVGANQTLSVDAGDYPLLAPLLISNTSGIR